LDIYYLYNSGFVIEHGGDAIVVDYYRGGLGGQWRMPLPAEPLSYRDIYVFASHAHGDHYTPEIFTWREEHPGIRYVLSDDIRPHGRAILSDITYLADGREADVVSLRVKAYGSTDQGISFHIRTADGLDIFHAGDLNFWHWADESTRAEVEEADADFTRELAKIRAGIRKLDAAFFPVDPRVGRDYYRGAVRFCEAMKPALLIPMHFGSSFDPPAAFFEEVAPYTRVVPVGPDAGRLVLRDQ
jgi:L-ascorbate metabolism protein UlaG (beta-lactamase superfamily)